jgi:hypothetical protein
MVHHLLVPTVIYYTNCERVVLGCDNCKYSQISVPGEPMAAGRNKGKMVLRFIGALMRLGLLYRTMYFFPRNTL